MSKINALTIAVTIIVLGVAVFIATRPPATGTVADIPIYASGNPTIQKAYTFASQESEKLDEIPCFCGCMQHLHDGRLHTRGLLDCFMKPDGSFDRHASQCQMCIDDTLTAKKMMAEGKTKAEVQAWINAKYAKG